MIAIEKNMNISFQWLESLIYKCIHTLYQMAYVINVVFNKRVITNSNKGEKNEWSGVKWEQYASVTSEPSIYTKLDNCDTAVKCAPKRVKCTH